MLAMAPNNSTRFQALVDAIVRKTTQLTSFFEAVGHTTRLHALVAALQRKWGPAAFRRLRGTTNTVTSISTGYDDLDGILEVGGLPRGHITELLGAPTSGAVTLALTCLAEAQAGGETVAYVDLSDTFDPEYAEGCGVDVADLLLVRPQSNTAALDIVCDLVAGEGLGLVVVDSVTTLVADEWNQWAFSSGLRRLENALHDSPCALVFVTWLAPESAYRRITPGGSALAHHASLRLWCYHERWLWDGQHELTGYIARSVVHKNKLGRPDRSATLEIAL